MSLPSVFPDMKSVNPAVIGLRKSGILKLSGATETYDKELKITKLNDAAYEADQKDEVTITNLNLFKGGKGGGTTSEWMLDYTTGKQETEFKSTSWNANFDIDSKAYYGKYALGFQSRWGIEFHYLGYNSKYTQENLENGSTVTSEIEIDINMPGVRIGKIVGSPGLSLGLMAELNFFSNKMKSSDANVEMPDDGAKPMPVVGVALGSGGPNGLFEVGVEADLRPQEKVGDEPKPSMPIKGSVVLEGKIKGIILGYKGMAYKGQFIDFEKIIPTQMVYKNSGDELRLEHIINFMLKPEKGFSIGGSFSMSNTETQEKSSIIMSSNKHDTKIKSMGFSVKLGYVW